MSLPTVTAQAHQGHVIAQIALRLPERPTTGDVLTALNQAFTAGMAAAITAAAPRREVLHLSRGLTRQAL